MMFDNKWLLDVWQNYNLYFLIILPGFLKIIAIIHPGVKTNQIIDLVQSWVKPNVP
jgi:hypothetical protein